MKGVEPLVSNENYASGRKKVEHPSFRKNALCKFALSQGAIPLFQYKDKEKN